MQTTWNDAAASCHSPFVTMDERVAQLAYSTRHLTYPHYNVSLQLHYKECYIIQSGQHAVDYTGMRVWPGAHLLTHFLLHSQHTEHSLHQQLVCELGAGVGLCGLTAALYARRVVLTDRVGAVLAVIDRNIALNRLSTTASSHVLEWGSSSARCLIESLQLPSPVSVVIAADVVYPDTTDDSIHALFDTVTTLLSSSSSSASASSCSPLHGRFVLSYVNRSAATCRRFLHIAHSHHYTATHVPLSTYLVDTQQQQAMSTELQQLHGYILLFERVDEQQWVAGEVGWMEEEPYVSMMASERNGGGESEQQQRAVVADEDESNELPMSGWDEEEVALSGQHQQSAAV